MTKSEIFIKAHQIAKSTVAAVGHYVIAFSLALKKVYKMAVEKKLVITGKNGNKVTFVYENGIIRSYDENGECVGSHRPCFRINKKLFYLKGKSLEQYNEFKKECDAQKIEQDKMDIAELLKN